MEKDKKTINRCSECGLYKIYPGVADNAVIVLRQQLKNHAIGITKSLRKNAIHKWKNVLMRKNNLWFRRD